MAICWFNSNMTNNYQCEYSVESESILVDVEYDIGTEIETVDGVRVWNVNTTFSDRDILITDAEIRKSFLLKDAVFVASSSQYGSYAKKEICTFQSNIYFESSHTEKLTLLPATPKISKIRLHSQMIADYLNYPSYKMDNSEDSCSVILSKNPLVEEITIQKNNIKRIALTDSWKAHFAASLVKIELSGYVEIELCTRKNYIDINSYIYELMIYMQLYCPGKFVIDYISVEVNHIFYGFFVPVRKPTYTEKKVDYSVDCSLLDFLNRCYKKIPYRQSRNEVRNIPFVIMNPYRGMEDDFLMLYRFIECYYKRRGEKTMFLTRCFEEHYPDKHKLSDWQILCYVHEICSLRNHYVHSGYFIKNNALRIRFNKESKDERDYTVKADAEWIYDRTKLLHSMVIHIIFTGMIGIEKYKY